MMRKIVPPALAIGAAVLAALAMPAAPALACNPDDCYKGMSKEDLARDSAETRRLNLQQKRYVDQRDAQYAKGWRAQRDHKAAMAEHERRMAEWREAVRRCEAGDWRYCQR